ncbi:CIA30 family protein [Xylariales sp. AK1849]|nr:CIA30 family protein [Xylariales sp. AK1849]
MAKTDQHLDLFGGRKPWSPDSWVSSDDRVRGGKSQSYLDCPSDSEAVFRGQLDITTLGGAGFASQRTVDPESWDLASYDGLMLKVGKSDGKKYTLILKDEMLPKRPDGREQSTVSWEHDFVHHDAELFIPWNDFKPTYRGKSKPDAEPLDLENIKRISIMMRSFFGEQEGPFRLEISSIAASKNGTHKDRGSCSSLRSVATASTEDPSEKIVNSAPDASWFGWACGLFGRGNL